MGPPRFHSVDIDVKCIGVVGNYRADLVASGV